MRSSVDSEVSGNVGLSERDAHVLRVIEEEELTSFSFEGLKRRIGAHPETLSRALERLQGSDIIEKGTEGYRVTRKGRELLGVRPAAGGDHLTLLSTMLPPGVDSQRVFTALRGKWFGNLRWLGYSEEGGLVMKWVTDDGKVQLDARFTPSGLTIEGRLLQGRTLVDAVTAAHRLLAHISKYSNERHGRATSLQTFRTGLVPN